MTKENNKNNTEFKTIIKKFNEHYNIVKIYRKNIIDFYLEKIGYGHLFYIVGTQNDIELTNNYIYICIGNVERSGFWGSDMENTLLEEYDYDDVKIAVVIAEAFKDWNIYCDFEEIALLVIKIKRKWQDSQKYGSLTKEEYVYIQKFARGYLNEHKDEIMEEFT